MALQLSQNLGYICYSSLQGRETTVIREQWLVQASPKPLWSSHYLHGEIHYLLHVPGTLLPLHQTYIWTT